MTWVRLDDSFPEHPKVVGLPDPAFRLYVIAMCYSARNLTDGFIPSSWLKGGGKEPKAVAVLVEAGLWDVTEGGYQVHDYLKYQSSRAYVEDKRTQARTRMSLARSSRDVRANIPETFREVREDRNRNTRETEIETQEKIPPPLVSRRKPWNFHEGIRIEVPQRWHEDHVRKLGLPDAEAKLLAWYADLDAQLVRSQRPVGNWFKWLDACYEPWANDLAASQELENFRPKGA
jgi:hypothetical protein